MTVPPRAAVQELEDGVGRGLHGTPPGFERVVEVLETLGHEPVLEAVGVSSGSDRAMRNVSSQYAA